MSAALAILVAVCQAACSAVAGTLQHTTAARGRTSEWTPTGHLAGFARHQVTQRLWWASVAVQAGSLVLHATALQLASLTVVQPVLALTVVLALPLSHRVHHTRVSRAELGWAVLVTASLAVFLATVSPGSAASPIPPARLAVPAGAAAVAGAGCILLARRMPPRAAAVTLGVAAGIAFSLEAALLQATIGPLLSHPLATLATVRPYVLFIVGSTGVALTQLAYRAGPISCALPAIVAVNPIASVLLDNLAGTTSIPTGPGALAAETLTLAGLTAGVIALTRNADPVQRATRSDARRAPRC